VFGVAVIKWNQSERNVLLCGVEAGNTMLPSPSQSSQYLSLIGLWKHNFSLSHNEVADLVCRFRPPRHFCTSAHIGNRWINVLYIHVTVVPFSLTIYKVIFPDIDKLLNYFLLLTKR
jgi:hypothetical protein